MRVDSLDGKVREASIKEQKALRINKTPTEKAPANNTISPAVRSTAITANTASQSKISTAKMTSPVEKTPATSVSAKSSAEKTSASASSRPQMSYWESANLSMLLSAARSDLERREIMREFTVNKMADAHSNEKLLEDRSVKAPGSDAMRREQQQIRALARLKNQQAKSLSSSTLHREQQAASLSSSTMRREQQQVREFLAEQERQLRNQQAKSLSSDAMRREKNQLRHAEWQSLDKDGSSQYTMPKDPTGDIFPQYKRVAGKSGYDRAPEVYQNDPAYPVYEDKNGKHTLVDGFYDFSSAWAIADEMFDYFSDPKNGYAEGCLSYSGTSESIMSEMRRDIGVIQPGDLLFWDSDQDGHYNHASVVVGFDDSGNLLFAAHSSARCQDKIDISGTWETHPEQNLTIIQMRD